MTSKRRTVKEELHPRMPKITVLQVARNPETCGASKDASGIPICTLKDDLCVGTKTCPFDTEA